MLKRFDKDLSALSLILRSILLVDDHENEIILTKLKLEKAGLAQPIHGVQSGLQAIAFLSGDPPYQDRSRYPFPSLVLLDLRMPGMDGLEVLRWIRKQSRFETLPVIMLTGSEDPKDFTNARTLGASSFFPKTMHSEDLSDLLREVQRLMRI